MELFKLLLSNFILNSFSVLVWHNIFNKKTNYKDYKFWISIILLTVLTVICIGFENKLYKILILLLVFTLVLKYLFKEPWIKSIIGALFYELIIMIAESLYLFLLALFVELNSEIILKYYADTLMTNTIIGLFAILISKIPFVKTLFNLLNNLFKKAKKFQILILCIVSIISIVLFPFTVYYKIDFTYLLILYFSLDIMLCFIMVYILITKNKYKKVSSKYNIALNSLKDYEDMMSKYRVSNHENKNLLLTIRAMILNKEKDIPKYIDTMIENKFNDDEKLLFKMNVIPSGGLRATIYSEILKIKDKKIDYSLNIDSRVKTVDLINLETNEIIDICKIIGVFIDNAIEAVSINSKNKHIDISLFMLNTSLNIKITNNYKGKIDIEKLNKAGYTTKKKPAGHGYGLTLVKNIVDASDKLKVNTETSKELFSQTLEIKYIKK